MIAFSCSSCGMKFSVLPEFAGRATRCRTCKQPLVVPAPERAHEPMSADQLNGACSSLVDAGVHDGVTLITEDSAPSPGQRSVSDLLAGKKSSGGRYIVEGEIARGGMGAVLRAVDRDIRREVAVKYMLSQVDPRKKLRFIEEAQITGQLEHPNIVPIHELGLDANKRLFFSMKMVKGRSLGQALDLLRTEPKTAEKEYPLGRLLNVFVNVCNALAYAHARGVIHRDLKPANIMIGDFGEVYVMDWGLAKVLKGDGAAEREARPPMAIPIGSDKTAFASGSGFKPPLAIPIPSDKTAITSGSGVRPARAASPSGSSLSSGSGKVATARESDADLTQDGAVMGTPVYMPPEQATGRIQEIDQRSDVYSLGAILYELMALRPPINKEGGDLAVLMRVIEGKIVPPEKENPQRARAGRVPLELSAIAMKALAIRQEDRYPTVETLRKDVERFLEGRSVSAKEDTKRELFVKFVKRNKGFSAAAAAALVLLTVVVVYSSVVNFKARRAAEKAYEAYEIEQTEKEKRTRQAVPALVEVARSDVERRLFDKALTQVKLALEYDPDNLDARLLKGQLLIVKEDFKEGSADLQTYLKRKPKDAETVELNKLCGKPKPGDVGNLVQIAQVFTRQQYPALAEGLLRRHGPSGDAVRQQLLELFRKRIEAAWPGRGPALTLDKAGLFNFWIGGDDVLDLAPLKDIPLSGLGVDCRNVKSLAALQGMPLTTINMNNCLNLPDLAGLKGLPLTTLNINNCERLTDVSALHGLPLASLQIDRCNGIRDFSPLRGPPLKALFLQYCGGLNDLSGLKGLPLNSLYINAAGGIRDLTPLRGMPLTTLSLLNFGELRDLSGLEGLPLTTLNLNGCGILRDLTPLQRLPLTLLDLGGCSEVRDLKPLQGLPLGTLHLSNCSLLVDLSGLKGLKLSFLGLSGCGRLQDLTPLKGMPLRGIDLRGCASLRELAALKGMPFTQLNLENCGALEDLGGLKGMPLNNLTINGCGQVRDLGPLQGMPLNSLFLSGCARVVDLAPLKDLPLNQIDLRGCAGIRELTALKGMKFNKLDLSGCTDLVDLSSLKGMPLSQLALNSCTKLRDLAGLKGLPLNQLHMDSAPRVKDLAPLAGLPLTTLAISNCGGIDDLSGLKGLPLTSLFLNNCGGVSDLSPLKGSPLTALNLGGCARVANLAGLKGLPLTSLEIPSCSVKDLTPIQGFPLTRINMQKCVDLHDLTPLKGMKLTEVYLPPQVTKGMKDLREMKSLQSIDGRGAVEFWRNYDASQPKPK